MSDVTKCCTTCGEDKLLTAFYRRRAGKFGRAAKCKKCVDTSERKAQQKDSYYKNHRHNLKRQREYYQENREAALNQQKERYASDPEYRESCITREKARKVGLSVDAYTKKYDELLELQAGCCAICGQHVSQVQLVMDHRHSDMLVRGLLCGDCNTAIGFLMDDPKRAEGAVRYLKSF